VETLKLAGFGGELLEPSDPAYEDARLLWNAMIDKRPALIARCRSAKDVVAAITHARREGLEVAVRGGGHSIGGHSSTEGGMMIDLKPINGIVVDPDARRARVGGGALLGEMDRATQAHGLAATGGMVHHAGVGG
jgi:FAD/FMN-containing dehydrogenase